MPRDTPANSTCEKTTPLCLAQRLLWYIATRMVDDCATRPSGHHGAGADASGNPVSHAEFRGQQRGGKTEG